MDFMGLITAYYAIPIILGLVFFVVFFVITVIGDSKRQKKKDEIDRKLSELTDDH